MSIIKEDEAEEKGIVEVAQLMLVSAKTAPKAGGIGDILSAIVSGKEKDDLALEMEKVAEERSVPNFKRDAMNVRDSNTVVLIGVRGIKSMGLDCGGCGYLSCKEFEESEKKTGRDFTGPNCIFKLLDLGIALGSAVKTASILNVDNRIMYRIGTAAKRLNLLPEASVIMGIPLSSKSKSVYFDRK
jgi:uncharacterized ferredoxin-like protein